MKRAFRGMCLAGFVAVYVVSSSISSADQAATPAVQDKGVGSGSIDRALVHPRTRDTRTILPDGSVAVIGGVDAQGRVVRAIEVVDPASGESRVIENPSVVPRAGHTATLLTDGRVLVAGGQDESARARRDAQIWNPETGDATSVAGTLTGAASQTAVLAADGAVLFRSELGSGTVTDRFDPATGQLSALTPDQARRADSATAADVAAMLPASDSAGAPVDTRIAIRLGELAADGAVTPDTVSLIGPAGAVNGKVVVAEEGRLLFFTPQSDLLPQATYTIFFNGLPTAAGHSLPFSTSTFTTRGVDADTDAAARARLNSPGAKSGTASRDSTSPQRAQARTPAQPTVTTRVPPNAKDKSRDEQADDDEVEDWTPGPEHRHGDWRVLGSKREPHSRRALSRVAPLIAADGTTAVAGRIARLNGRALAGVPVRIGDIATTTDDQGRFLLKGVPAGAQRMSVQGGNVAGGGRRYLTHYIQVEARAGETTALSEPIYLAREDRTHEVSFSSPTDREVVVTHPGIPGLELHIPKGAVLRSPDGKIVTRLSITPLPVNRVPFAVPNGFPVYFAIQPAGVFVDNSGSSEIRGIRVIYPNYLDAPPGKRVVFWNYDPDAEGWQVYGHGTVSEDGKRVAPDAGVTQKSLMSFGWGLENTDGVDEAQPVGSCATGGDPVDCATGLFLHSATDFYIEDTIPITLTRTYRPKDPVSRDFGIGFNHSYGWFLSNPTTDTVAPAILDVILQDGGRVRFNRIAGSVVGDLVFQHNATPGTFQGATLRISTITHAWEMTLRDKSVYVFEPHSPNRLIGFRDRFGNSVTITRASGRITQITSPHGRSLNFIYESVNGNSRIKQVSDHTGRTVVYDYDSSSRLWKVTDPNGKVEQYGYDTANRMTTVTDRRGNVMVTNEYDSNGRVWRQTLADGAIWQFAYTLDSAGKVTQTDITDPRGNVTRDVFNASGYVTQQTLAVGKPEQRTTSYTREPFTNLTTSITDFLGRVTRIENDYLGRVKGVTRLYGTANAVTQSFTFDPVSDQVSSVTDPLSHTTQMNYDGIGNLVSVSDPLGHTVTLTHDIEGNVSSLTNAIGKTTHATYDLGDLASITDPLNRTASFFADNLGRVVGVTDPEGNNTTVGYDVLDRITKVTDAQSGVTAATYDENGNLRTVTDPRNLAAHVFEYDARDRIHTYTDPLGIVETYEYDGLGNLLSKEDRRGQLTAYEYDALNRLKLATYPDGSTLTVTWDDAARTVTFADSTNGTITRIYDDLGRLTRESSPQGQVDYQYDAAGRPYQTSVAGIGTPITYSFDAANRLMQIAQGGTAVGFTYDAADRPATTTLPNGVVKTHSFDDADQLTGLVFDKGATHIGDLAYGYNGAGQRTSISGSLARLVMGQPVSGAAYDAANRLTDWNGVTPTYDNNGNMLSFGATAYQWNDRNQLAAVTAGSASFSYDAFGRRRGRVVSGATTSYLHDGSNPLRVNSDLMLEGFGLDDFYARISGGTVTSHLTDALGSTLALSDTSGETTASYSYGARGQSTKTGGADTPFQFTGRENDGPTQLQYNRARYYSAEIGRFISEDGIGLEGGTNLYVYGDNDPISETDPTGNCPWCVGAVLGGGLDLALQLIQNGGRFQCVNWTSVGVSAALGAVGGGFAQFGRQSLVKTAGKEWSHWIPDRYFRPSSKFYKPWLPRWLNGSLNGKYVTPWRHYKHDYYRYPRGWRDYGEKKWNPVIQQLDRIPDWITGSVGVGATGAAVATNAVGAGSDCGCEN